MVGAGVVVAGAVSAGAASGAGGAFFFCSACQSLRRTTFDALNGAEFSGTPRSAYCELRASRRETTGAPLSITRVPGAGVCTSTVLAANPSTSPLTRQAKPASWRIPLAKT